MNIWSPQKGEIGVNIFKLTLRPGQNMHEDEDLFGHWTCNVVQSRRLQSGNRTKMTLYSWESYIVKRLNFEPKVTKHMEPNNRGMEDEFYIPTVFVFFLGGGINFGEALQLKCYCFEAHFRKPLVERSMATSAAVFEQKHHVIAAILCPLPQRLGPG